MECVTWVSAVFPSTYRYLVTDASPRNSYNRASFTEARRIQPFAPFTANRKEIKTRMFRTAIKSRMIRHIALTVTFCTIGPMSLVAWLAHMAPGLSLPALWLAGSVVALLCAGAAVIHMVRRYMPGIQALLHGLQQLGGEGGSQLADAGRDDWRTMIGAFNRASAALQERNLSLQVLGEIDRLLLAADDLEQAVDAILTRVQRMTACHTAAIVLRDTEACARGRVFMASDRDSGLPLSRVALDERMMATLAAATSGLTVTRCEEVRHSFLRPLRDQGAEFFWVWPVLLNDGLRAILAVGFSEAPGTGAQLAQAGTELVQRLGVVLARSAREEQLYRQAHYDPLTGLPNRVLFASTLSPEIDSAVAGMARGSVLYVDLDHFKKVNDTAGHAAGDQLLCIAAQRLRACVKEHDTVARLGGDEFAVILRDVDSTHAAAAVGERIVESLRQAVRIGGRDHYICASIGMAMYPEDGASIEELLRNADTAMYRAKDLGRGRAVAYDLAMGGAKPAPTQTGLQLALRQREFSLFYQPQYATSDGALTGLEGLLRWQTQRSGMRVPGDFVPAAEESGLIVDIGGWVLEAACEQLAQWRAQGLEPPPLSLNVSARQLRHPGFVGAVRRALTHHGLPAQLLELDIEEPAFADPECVRIVGRLTTLGVRLALDGFSTSYASLSYLRQHPLSCVKLDRAFLNNVPGDATAAQLVETVIVIAHSLGKRVVAEGIETIEQLDFLRERGCDSVQGFYLAKPLQVAAMTELLSSRAGHEALETRAVV